MLALALLLTTAVGAAPANQATVIAIQDTYINRASPGSTYDNGLLFLQQNLTSFETDKVALIKFDLSAVSFPITKARLSLSAVSGCVDSNVVPEIYVYAAGDRWSENSSWNDVGGLALRGALKDDMDETSYTAPAVLHWTDESGLSTGLAAYLEQERNTTDHIASLWVQIAGNGANKVVFEDSELSGSATCTGAILAPTLQLADVGQPLSVNMSTFRSADPAVNWSLIAGLGALALVVIGGLAVARKRAMGR